MLCSVSNLHYEDKWGKVGVGSVVGSRALILNAVRCVLLVSAAFGLDGFLIAPRLHAQDALSSSYITPFPPTERYQLRVLGDWLGAGLASGLQDAFKQEASLQITDGSKSTFGLVKGDQSELMLEADKIVSGGQTNIVVIMLGMNERQFIRLPGGPVAPGSTGWKDAYAREAEKFIKKFRAANVAVYWVGMPIMGNAAYNDTINAVNDAARQASYLNGARFINTSTGFTDERGAYSAFGPDLTGQTKRLREGDGLQLTAAGNRKLANYVEIIIRRDLTQARAQRNIPLAGDEEEQARIASAATSGQSQAVSAVGPGASGTVADKADVGGRSPSTSGALENDRLAPSSTMRQDQAAFSSTIAQGELIMNDIGNGLTAIAVISPINDFSARDIQQQTPLNERLYYRVLRKGEALPSKEGRADDFRWAGTPPTSQ